MQYHYHIQGLVYRLLRGNRKYDVHNKQGYKFFSFSNIFPIGEMKKNNVYNLILSSPNNSFVSSLRRELESLDDIEIGRMKFRVNFCDQFEVMLPKFGFSLITGTPIIMRIRRERYEDYDNMKSVRKYYKYIYWRIDHPIELFIDQLENNLVKKYNEYFGLDIQHQAIFTRFKPPKKQVSTRLCINHSEPAVLVGTTWEFMFDQANPLLQFALDAGLGELNSMGFGFMNLGK